MDWTSIIRWLTLLGLITMMLSMGLKVTIEEVVAVLRRPWQIVLGLLANFVLFPLATVFLLRIFDPLPVVAVGFLILAIFPGAPVGPPFVSLARGDVPFAIGLMVVLGVLSALLTPLLLLLSIDQLLPGSTVNINIGAIIGSLMVAQFLPVAVGLALHHWVPVWSNRLVKPISLLGALMLVAVLILIVIQQYETLALVRIRGWFGMLLLLAMSLAIGWVCGGGEQASRKALSLTTASRNVAVALVIVSGNFADTPAMTAVVAYALLSIVGALGFALILARLDPTPRSHVGIP